jgi:hypothetical protein
MNSQLDSNLEFLGKVESDSLAYLSGILFGDASAAGQAKDWQAVAGAIMQLGASYQELVDGVVERVGLTAALNGKSVIEKESSIVESLRRPILKQMAIMELDKSMPEIPEDMSDKDLGEVVGYQISSKMEKDSKAFSMEEMQLILKMVYGDDSRMEMLLQMAEAEQKQVEQKKSVLPEPFIPALRAPKPNIGKIVQAIVEVARLRKSIPA